MRVLALIVRGLPSLLVYGHDLRPRQRLEMTFITATSLPLLIALADIDEAPVQPDRLDKAPAA